MNFFVLSFAVFSFASILFSSIEARITSSHDHHAQSPTLVTYNNKQNVDNLPFKRFQAFMRRTKRDAPSLDASSSQLGNETLHNQALIHWSGNYSTVIFILTRKKDSGGGSGEVTNSTLWRSTDYGKTYSEETAKFDKQASLISYYTCPRNKKKIIFIDSHGSGNHHSRVWVSTTEGENYTAHEVAYNLDKILFHPTQEDWLLGYDKESSVLIASIDLGKTWHKIHDRVSLDRYYWYKEGVDTGPDAEKMVFFEYQDFNFARPFHFVRSCLVPNCDYTAFQDACDRLGRVEERSLLVQDDYIFVQKPGALEKLYVSYRRDEFVKAKFHRSGEQTDIHVISSHSNTAVVGVNHDDRVTNLYFSDEKARDFSLSLENVLYFHKKVSYTDAFTVDIHEVKGVKGVYIANHRQHYFNRTMITWDNGKSWHKLNLPADNPVPSCNDCTLNLHCAMSQTKSGYYMPSMLSKESAPGLIVAHGSVAKTLYDSPHIVRVYVSNDTGVTWRAQIRNRNLFVVGDQGAILIAVNMYVVRAVQTLSVSTDFGVSWRSVKFTDEKVNVDGILTEPGDDTHIFTLFGHVTNYGPWKIFSIDMSRIISRNCSYPQDFMNVTVPFTNLTTCHLGMHRTLETLHNTGCLITRQIKRKNIVRYCNCTMQDYECGFDYVSTANGDCKKLHPQIDWIDDIIDYDYVHLWDLADSCIDGNRNVTTEHRKIPGDRCINDIPGVLYTTEKCNKTAPLPPTEPPSTTTPSLPIPTTTPPGGFLRVVNISSAARVGERLQVVAQHCPVYKWRVTFLNDSSVITPFNWSKTNLTLSPRIPGVYRVMGACSRYTDYLTVSFYLAEVKQIFRARAFVTAPMDLPGIPEILGTVTFTWNYNGKSVRGPMPLIVAKPSHLSFGPGYLKTYAMRVTVEARNGVSSKIFTSIIPLPKTVVSRSILLFPSQGIEPSLLSSSWLHDLRGIVTQHFLLVDDISDLLSSNHLYTHHHFHVYIEPKFPLNVSVYFSSNLLHSREQLQKISSQFNDIIMRENIVMHLPHEQQIYVGHLPTSSSTGVSAAVIVVIVIISMILIIALVLVARKYGRARRWKSYFTMRGAHPTLRFSHIVRPRAHDMSPIVDEDDQNEFVDEQLEHPEYTDPPQDGTLEFKDQDDE